MGPPPPPPEEGEFTYRYVPCVGDPSKVDVEYTILHPFEREDDTTSNSEKLVTNSGSIKFHSCDWQTLPTLHHVAGALAEIPIYGIEKAEVLKEYGDPGIGRSIKIE